MAAVLQTTVLDTFSWMKMFELRFKISLKFVPKGRINNIPSLVQIMAWRRPGDKPLSEPVTVRLLTHICVIRPQWLNKIWRYVEYCYWQPSGHVVRLKMKYKCCNYLLRFTHFKPLAMLPHVGNFRKRRMTWKCFPNYLPFVRGIQEWPMHSPRMEPVMWSFDIFFFVSQNNESSRWWFDAYLRPILPTWINSNPTMD